MNGQDPCVRCGHDMDDMVYSDGRAGPTRRFVCRWCRMVRMETTRRHINAVEPMEFRLETELALARQSMVAVINDLESEGPWL